MRSLVAFGRDVRLGVRTLIASPAFSFVTALLTALGIGATTTLVSLTYGVLLKPLPWPEPDRLVRLQETRGGKPGRVPWTITNTTYHAWRERPDTIEDLGAWRRGQLMTFTVGAGEPERLRVTSVTPSLFRVLGTSPTLGRMFTDDDLAVGDGPAAILIAYDVWQRRFGGHPNTIGQSFRLDDRLVTIIGIMPKSFIFPDRETEAWMPMRIARVQAGAEVIAGQIVNAMARLRPGVTPEQASAEATARGRAAPSLGNAGVGLFGNSGTIIVAAVSARQALTEDVKPALTMLLLAVVLIFITALASVLVLQTARAAMRRREMAVRMAIGANRGALIRQWLAESTPLGITAGAAGLALAAGLHRVLPALLPPDFPRTEDVTLDVRVSLVCAALTTVVVLVSGLVPALQSSRRNVREALSSDGTAVGRSTASVQSSRLRAVMMAAQVAIACFLLVGTALMGRSLVALVHADRGFDPRDVLSAHLTMKARPFAPGGDFERIQQRLQALPGVTAVGFGDALPFVTSGGFRAFTLPSPRDAAVKMQAQTILRTVSPDYFAAMGLRVVEGRAIERTDTASSRPIVVVNKTFARLYLTGRPLGTILPMQLGAYREWEVVGIVDDLRQGGLAGAAPLAFGGVADPPQPEMFFTYRQWTSPVTEMAYVIRTSSNPEALTPMLRSILREEDPALVVDSIMTMEDRVQQSLARPRTYAILLGGFAIFALAIAAVGLFAVLSYATTQRRREIGIRTALGAQARDILRLVTQEMVAIFTAGIAIGLSAAFVLARLIQPLIYGVSTHDAVTFTGVPILLCTVGAIACALPALRAVRTNPLSALRDA